MDMDMDIDVGDGAGSDATVEKLIAAGRVQECARMLEEQDCEEGSVGHATRRNRQLALDMMRAFAARDAQRLRACADALYRWTRQELAGSVAPETLRTMQTLACYLCVRHQWREVHPHAAAALGAQLGEMSANGCGEDRILRHAREHVRCAYDTEWRI